MALHVLDWHFGSQSRAGGRRDFRGQTDLLTFARGAINRKKIRAFPPSLAREVFTLSP
jgi:hypothetical protein